MFSAFKRVRTHLDESLFTTAKASVSNLGINRASSAAIRIVTSLARLVAGKGEVKVNVPYVDCLSRSRRSNVKAEDTRRLRHCTESCDEFVNSQVPGLYGGASEVQEVVSLISTLEDETQLITVEVESLERSFDLGPEGNVVEASREGLLVFESDVASEVLLGVEVDDV